MFKQSLNPNSVLISTHVSFALTLFRFLYLRLIQVPHYEQKLLHMSILISMNPLHRYNIQSFFTFSFPSLTLELLFNPIVINYPFIYLVLFNLSTPIFVYVFSLDIIIHHLRSLLPVTTSIPLVILPTHSEQNSSPIW